MSGFWRNRRRHVAPSHVWGGDCGWRQERSLSSDHVVVETAAWHPLHGVRRRGSDLRRSEVAGPLVPAIRRSGVSRGWRSAASVRTL